MNRQSLFASLLMLVLVCSSVRGEAQCVGDCGGEGAVTVDEIITGVNIALGTLAIAQCPNFDSDHSETVTVDEIITAVNNALNGCPAANSPTPTATATQSVEIGTPTPTRTVVAGCGDGQVDFFAGETCDDGNLVEGDSCPANCRIATCAPSGTTTNISVNFGPPVGVDLVGLTVFVRYPDGRVGIPGSGGSPLVLNRLFNIAENAIVQPNDIDYGLYVVAFAPDASTINPGPLFSVELTACQGGDPVTTADFGCTVTSASDAEAHEVPGVTCSVSIP